MEKQRLVLLVEDDENNRRVYTTILTHFGYAVLEAVNGEAGVMQAVHHRPDLILMDLSMPVMDGWGAVERIRNIGETATIPVIALSAHDPVSHDWRTAGFSDYLCKPCLPHQLIDAVKRLLGPEC